MRKLYPLLALVLAGCLEPGRHRESLSPVPAPAEAAAATATANDRVRTDVPEGVPFIAGWSVENRAIRYQVFGKGPDTALVLATIHGNEAAGTPLVRRLALHLDRNPRLLEGRRVILCPLLNPDGFAHGSRFNARGVDLNRNYPAANFRGTRRHGPKPVSEPESQVVLDLLETFKPDRVVSIHQPLNCIDHDGPAAGLARAMGRHTDIPVKKIGARPGSLGSYVGVTLGVPIITLEFPGAASRLSGEELWFRYGPILLAFVEYRGGAG